MSKKILENVQLSHTWTSYIGSVEGALRGAGLWTEETFKLMGMTGLAFHFIVHKNLCPSAVTVYDWSNGHLAAMDRIGVHSKVHCTMDIRMNTYKKIWEDAVDEIRKSIDRGIGVVVWAPTRVLEFGIIRGYDDEDRVFFVSDCMSKNPDPLLYANLGKSDVPMLFYQIFKSKVEVDREKIFRDSLDFGVREWKKEFHINPDYSSGRKGYGHLTGALERDDFDEFGLAYILAVYADAKQCIARYLRFIHGESVRLKGLDRAAEIYEQVEEKFKKMTELVPFTGMNGAGCRIDRSRIPTVLSLAGECGKLEEQGMRIIEAAVKA